MTAEVRDEHGLDEARQRVRSIWQAMAPGWGKRRDYLAEFSIGITEWMVDRLDPRPGQTILDLAAGTGDTGFAAARRVGPQGRLICTDFAANMVEVARSRAAETAVTNVEFRVLDAERNDLPTASVDGVLCRWGYSLMLDPVAALLETRRVLRDGGTLALSVMGSLTDNPWGSRLMGAIVSLGLIEPPDPRHAGGLFSLADHTDLKTMLSRAGFAHIEIEEMGFRLRFRDYDDYWRFIIEFAGGVSALLQSFSDDQRAAVRRATEGVLTEFRTADGYDFPASTVNAAAR